MINMIKSLFYFITDKFILKNINKNIFKLIFNSLRTVLMSLPLSRLWNLLLELTWNKFSDNSNLTSLLNSISSWSNLESSKIIYDTPLKILF
jgi:hypothetical protein